MHAIGAFIHQDNKLRLRARIRNMLGHFLHDEWITNDKADDPGCTPTSLLAYNRAVVKLHKQHQSCIAQAFLDCAFSSAKERASRVDLTNSTISG